MAAAVTQAGDLASGWRLQRIFLRNSTDKGWADAVGERPLGGAQAFAERGGLQPRALDLTAIVELERSPRIACSALAKYRSQDLGEVRPLVARIGQEAFLRYSGNPVFGPHYEVAWFRGPVFALVEVQFRGARTESEAQAEAVRLARAQDARLVRLLAGKPPAAFRPRRVAGIATSNPGTVAVAWLRATAFSCTRNARIARLLELPRATRPRSRPCASEGNRFRAVDAPVIGDTAVVGVEITSLSGGYGNTNTVAVFVGRTPTGWRAHSTTLPA